MSKNKLLILLFLLLLTICFYCFKINNHWDTSLEELNLSILPEYQRNLTELAITIPLKKPSDEETLQTLTASYANLLLNIPSYTKVSVFTHIDNKELLNEFITDIKIPNKVSFIFSNNSNLEVWAQDYFEPVKNSSSSYLLLPKTTNKSSAFNRIEKRNVSFKLLEKSLVAPFFFEGGNLLAAKSPLGNFVFLDFDSIKKTQDLYGLSNKNLFVFQIKKLVQSTFPSSSVVVLGNKRRTGNFIHLDQSVLFLENNIVIINSIDDAPKSEAAIQHRLYKKQLESLGFKTKTISISIKDVENSTSSLNAIAYQDFFTNKNTILFPVYPDEIKDSTKQKSSLKKDDLQGKALEAFTLFSESGYVPVPIFDDVLYKKGGSLHCISNVLN